GFGVDVGRRTEDLLPGQGSSSAASVVRRDGRASASWSGEGPLALDASLLLVDEDQRWATGQLRHFADNVQGMLTLDGRWTGEAHTLGAAVHASRFDHLLRRGTQAVAPPESSGDRQVQSLAELDLMWGWDQGGDLVLDAGMELGRERIEAETVSSGERDRVTVEPYAQATVDVAGVSVVPGLRYSHSRL